MEVVGADDGLLGVGGGVDVAGVVGVNVVGGFDGMDDVGLNVIGLLD